jgi:hypothetical protein
MSQVEDVLGAHHAGADDPVAQRVGHAANVAARPGSRLPTPTIPWPRPVG